MCRARRLQDRQPRLPPDGAPRRWRARLGDVHDRSSVGRRRESAQPVHGCRISQPRASDETARAESSSILQESRTQRSSRDEGLSGMVQRVSQPRWTAAAFVSSSFFSSSSPSSSSSSTPDSPLHSLLPLFGTSKTPTVAHLPRRTALGLNIPPLENDRHHAGHRSAACDPTGEQRRRVQVRVPHRTICARMLDHDAAHSTT